MNMLIKSPDKLDKRIMFYNIIFAISNLYLYFTMFHAVSLVVGIGCLIASLHTLISIFKQEPNK